MNASDREPRNGMEFAFIRLLRQHGPQGQRAILDMILRRLDGQPLGDSMVECCIALGDPPATAHRTVREVLEKRATADWRRKLD